MSSVSLPPERAPKGSIPFGVRPLSSSTLSLSSLLEEEKRQIKIIGYLPTVPSLLLNFGPQLETDCVY